MFLDGIFIREIFFRIRCYGDMFRSLRTVSWNFDTLLFLKIRNVFPFCDVLIVVANCDGYVLKMICRSVSKLLLINGIRIRKAWIINIFMWRISVFRHKSSKWQFKRFLRVWFRSWLCSKMHVYGSSYNRYTRPGYHVYLMQWYWNVWDERNSWSEFTWIRR